MENSPSGIQTELSISMTLIKLNLSEKFKLLRTQISKSFQLLNSLQMGQLWLSDIAHPFLKFSSIMSRMVVKLDNAKDPLQESFQSTTQETDLLL